MTISPSLNSLSTSDLRLIQPQERDTPDSYQNQGIKIKL